MTELVGILNITPDSFSGDGLYGRPEDALTQAETMLEDGAAFVDMGAESTAPNAPEIDATEEWKRLKPVLPTLVGRYPGRFSIDTRHPRTAELALSLGPIIINDMSAMTNPAMVKVVADYGAPCIIGHIPGSDVHAAHRGTLMNDAGEVRDQLLERKARLVEAGLRPDEIILDPGIGFGKEPELSYELLRFAEMVPGHPVMVGFSNKRFIEDYFVEEGETRYDIEPNLRAARIAIRSGTTYMRVHKVAAYRRLLDELLY